MLPKLTGRETRATPKVGRRVPAAAWGLALAGGLAVAVIVALQMRKSPDAGAGTRPPTSEKSAPAAPAMNDKSIAVLPFENLSDDKTSGYFADGVQEDIITNLTFIRELKVVPRPTAMRFRDSKKSIRQIADELGVAYVLLGTVRKSGEKVRITGTLMNGRSEEQLWMKPYEKNLTDQFAIQAALATEIAGALSAVISPETQKLIRRVPTENAAAYDKYLRARELTNAGEPANSRRLEDLLREAVELDPKFAVAWAWLANFHGLAYLNNIDHSPERLRKAKTAIATAVGLEPDDPEVIYNLGYSYYHESRDYARALDQLERGARLQPGSAMWSYGFAMMERRMGKWVDALANLRRAVQLDPGNYDYAIQMFHVALAGRRFDEALVARQSLAALRDEERNEFEFARLHFLRDGSTREMETYFAKAAPDGQRASRRTWAATMGNYAEAIRLAGTNPSFENALCLAANGDLAGARDRMAKLAPPLRERLTIEPENATVLGQLGCMEAVLGNAKEALSCAQESMRLLPESIDTWMGPTRRVDLAFVYAWTGDKDRAIAEYRRLLRTPVHYVGANFGNVHVMKRHPAYFPLQSDPRFQRLLDDPKNNAPLF